MICNYVFELLFRLIIFIGIVTLDFRQEDN